MKERNTKISKETLFRSWLEDLIKKELGDFLIQQNEIQFLLTRIIRIRAVSRGLLDEKLIKKLERSTLGLLIDFYKICVNSKIEEGDLAKELEKYNSLRNKLVHHFLEIFSEVKIDKVPSPENKEEYLKKLNINEPLEIGKRIIPKLFSIIEENKKSNFKLRNRV